MTDESNLPESVRSSSEKKKKRTVIYIFLIRWWSVGAVYFFIAWGTGLGARDSVADLVFFLGVTIGLFNSLIVNPILKSVFDVGWHRPYAESTFGQRMAGRGKDVALALVTSILVFLLYRGINTAAISLFDLPEDQVFLPGEPILYALFFTIVSSSIVRVFTLVFHRAGKDSQ